MVQERCRANISAPSSPVANKSGVPIAEHARVFSEAGRRDGLGIRAYSRRSEPHGVRFVKNSRSVTPAKRSTSLGSMSANVRPSSTSTPKTTHMTRQAQRYSSLKKRKQGPNTLLNRLFCNSPIGLANNNSILDDEEDEPQSTVTVQSGSSAEENKSPKE